jgi:hypothetical protein
LVPRKDAVNFLALHPDEIWEAPGLLPSELSNRVLNYTSAFSAAFKNAWSYASTTKNEDLICVCFPLGYNLYFEFGFLLVTLTVACNHCYSGKYSYKTVNQSGNLALINPKIHHARRVDVISVRSFKLTLSTDALNATNHPTSHCVRSLLGRFVKGVWIT